MELKAFMTGNRIQSAILTPLLATASLALIQFSAQALDQQKQCCHDVPSRFGSASAKSTEKGAILIPAGEFAMGSDEQESYKQERPAHRVKLNSFWIDQTEVTNSAFEKFVAESKHKTVAEIAPDWEELKTQLPPGTAKPADNLLVPASLVFHPPNYKVTVDDISQWWRWTPGASWRHPEGPKSSIKKRMSHPVVHVAYQDAEAFCKHHGKRLPTEAEWEFAARGGLEGKRFAWGDSFKVDGKLMANVFQGSFPDKNSSEDGYDTTSPVKSFPPNGYALYDMIGNVWEWTADWYNTEYYNELAGKTSVNPQGAEKPYNPENPFAKERVVKGGSFLCSESYCVNYRPSSRRGTAYDSGASNIGFRCVKDLTT